MEVIFAYGEVVDGRLVLPVEALAILPANTPLAMMIAPETGIVTVRARDPAALQNEEFLESLAELNSHMTLEEYVEPAPESQLRREKIASLWTSNEQNVCNFGCLCAALHRPD